MYHEVLVEALGQADGSGAPRTSPSQSHTGTGRTPPSGTASGLATPSRMEWRISLGGGGPRLVRQVDGRAGPKAVSQARSLAAGCHGGTPTASAAVSDRQGLLLEGRFSHRDPVCGWRMGELASKMDDELWHSRADIWGTAPGLPPEALRLLQAYFSHRGRANLPPRPMPTWGKLNALILAPAGSAPGVDGEPYEVYHVGSRFVAALLAQGTYAADMSDALLCAVLGPSVDLLVWIPKHPGAEWPNDFRPLQFPTCFRRLFGAIMADLVGPELEPQFSVDQAAVKGGQCGPNITLANNHLSTRPGPPPLPGDGWALFLDQDHATVEAHIREVVAAFPPCPATANFFGDQNKAFERVSMHWAAMTLDAWGMPAWVQRGLLALCQDKSVRSIRGKHLGNSGS